MRQSYFTIKKNNTYEQTINKSKFIAHLRRVEQEHEAKEFIEEVKNEHADATHNCSAYVIGLANEIQKAHDDGEPSGTAGLPMLNVLIKQELKNTAVIVTRYFGGIKLGAGGLIRAYGNSVSEAIHQNGIVMKVPVDEYIVTTPYDRLGKIENELQRSPYTLRSKDYGEHVDMHVAVNTDEREEFKKWIINISQNRVTFTHAGTSYMEKDV